MTIHSFLLLSFHRLFRCYTEDGFTVAFSSLDDFFLRFLRQGLRDARLFSNLICSCGKDTSLDPTYMVFHECLASSVPT